MDQSVPRSAAFDFSKTGQIASLEVAVSVLELPQSRFGRSSVKDVAYYRTVSKYRCKLNLLAYLYESRTCSAVVRTTICLCV